MNKIEAKKVTFSYSDKIIIKDITFTVGAGETWAIIGRNGAGKSTLLKCLCGLLSINKKRAMKEKTPSSEICHRGDVLINNINIANLSPRQIAKQIAYVPQGVGRIPPPFTVREYLAMARFPYGGIWGSGLSPDDKKNIENALELTDTVHLAERMMNTLSGGELQSAFIAGAAAQGTPFLLLDEPTVHLDPYHQENIRKLIERMYTQRGVSVITVTHDVNFALSTHNNILALVDGETFFCGTKKEFCINAIGNLSKIFSVDFDVAECRGGKIFYYVNGGAV
ncbi:MAG: ABC transporter ATP-binding protein [Chitinispirillales bacterium]|jgi:iron complex transport system ATP-binding protein|nr:ABC transporter ATP-binding protein [Chitinispirillales bacterium]